MAKKKAPAKKKPAKEEEVVAEEIEPAETVSETRVEYHCLHCQSLVTSYLKSMEQTLKNLVSMERFERSTE